MTSISVSNIRYPIAVGVWIDYGLRGRYVKGIFKDIQDKYHDVAQVIDPMELTEYMRAPISFREFQAVALWVMSVVFFSAFITILYLVYIFTMIDEVEEGLAARDIYYIILVVLAVICVLGTIHRQRALRRKITEYLEGLNRQVFLHKGVEFKMTYPWGCRGYRLTVTRFKEDPDTKNVSLMEEGS